MHTTIKTPGRLLIGLALTLALLLTPLFAQNANALDVPSASYGDIPEMDDPGTGDDLFGKRKGKKSPTIDAKTFCQDLRNRIEQHKSLLAFYKKKANPDKPEGDYNGWTTSEGFLAGLEVAISALEDMYRDYNCDEILAS